MSRHLKPDRQPPSLVNPDAERGVIGSILVDPRMFAEVRTILPSAESFAVASCGRIYSAMLTVADEGKLPELAAVEAHLRRVGMIDAELADTIRLAAEAVPTSINAAWYARDVAKQHRRRQAALKAERVQQLAINGAEPESIAEAARELAAVAEPEAATAADGPEPLRFVPFPVDALPNPIGVIVRRAAKALGCDPSFVAIVLLTALAAAIGNTRRLMLKLNWLVPPILWSAIVARSGDVKSPAIDVARKPVQARQKAALKRYRVEREVYDADLEEYERDRRDYQNGKRDDAPERPAEPIADRYWCDDVTLEAIAARLQAQPRGLLLIRDELAGWFGGFDRYVGGKGGDAPRWLEAFGGRPMLVDRKSGEPIHIDRAAVCITGSIQPAILKRSLSLQHRQNGLAARMLFAYPPRRMKRWTDTSIEPRDEQTIALIFDRLYELTFGTDAEGQPEPIVIRPTDEAKALFVAYFNEHNGEAADMNDDLGAAWSKLEEYPARLALVVHYVRWAANDLSLGDELQLDAASMSAGITLARWFAHEARRIYAMLAEGDDDADRRKLVEWIDRRGGRATARDVKIGNRRFKAADEAEKALIELVELGYGTWESSTGGGRPTRLFCLSTKGVVYESPLIPEENGGFVDDDNVDADHGGEWGEI